jgi:carboxymethylenebutenolidase
VSLPTTQGAGHARLWVEAGRIARPAIVVLHGDHGLTDMIEVYAKKLHDAGYVILALDLYRGEKADTILDAHIMDRGLSEERVKADLKGAVDYLASLKEVKKDALGIIGWDMGGGYALDAAIADPRLRAVVTCYGRVTTDAAQLAQMKASVLVIMAGKDEGNPPTTRQTFSEAMKKAGKQLTLEVFDKCDHGFMNPVASAKPTKDDKEALVEAWRHIETFFAARLRE